VAKLIDELSFIKGVFAIGEDGGGNPYVLISEPGREGVYYWERTHLHEGAQLINMTSRSRMSVVTCIWLQKILKGCLIRSSLPLVEM